MYIRNKSGGFLATVKSRLALLFSEVHFLKLTVVPYIVVALGADYLLLFVAKYHCIVILYLNVRRAFYLLTSFC